MFLFIIAVIGGAVYLILLGIGNAQEKNSTEENFKELLQAKGIEDYHAEYTKGNEYIIHDKTNGAFWICHHQGATGRYYEHISKVELVIDDSLAYESSIGSAVGRAVVGGVLAGGVGAVIGGVTGKKNGSKVVHKIEMIISYTTPDNPYGRVTFLSDKDGVDIFSDEYKRAEDSGLYWSNLISSYIGQER